MMQDLMKPGWMNLTQMVGLILIKLAAGGKEISKTIFLL